MAERKAGFTVRRAGHVRPPKNQDPDTFAWMNQVQELLEGSLGLGLRGRVIDKRTEVTAGSDIELFHGLGVIPFAIVDLGANNGTIYARDTERDKWTRQMLVVRATVNSPHVRILVILQPFGLDATIEED